MRAQRTVPRRRARLRRCYRLAVQREVVLAHSDVAAAAVARHEAAAARKLEEEGLLSTGAGGGDEYVV